MSPSESNLLVNDYVLSFQELISLQEGAIASFKKWIGALFLAGSAIIVIAVLLYSRFPGLAPPIVGIGGFVISGSAAFPYREIIPRRCEIIKYAHLKRRFEGFLSLSEEERKRTLDLADEMIRRSS